MPDAGRLRLLHITPRYPPARGGVEAFFAKVSRGLAARGHEVTVWTSDAATVDGFARRGGPASRDEAGDTALTVHRFPVTGVPVRRVVLTAAHLLPLGRGWRSAFQRWSPVLPGLWAAARRGRDAVDIVHAAGLPYSVFLWAAWRVARRRGARLVFSPFVHVGNPRDPGDRTASRYLSPLNCSLLREADLVFAQTPGERERLLGAGIAPDRVAVLGMGVDVAEVTGGNRDRARRRWGLPPAGFVVGHLANKSRAKGSLDLLAAVRGAHRDGARVHAWLAGPEMPDFARARPDYTGEPWLTLSGPLSDDERRDFYAAIDVFALPSVVESFGIVLLEAAANGVASVAYDVGGPHEVLAGERAGLLVQPGDVAALTSAIRRLSRDEALRASLAAGARALAGRRTWANVTDDVERAYRALTSHSSRPSSGVT